MIYNLLSQHFAHTIHNSIQSNQVPETTPTGNPRNLRKALFCINNIGCKRLREDNHFTLISCEKNNIHAENDMMNFFPTEEISSDYFYQ